MMVGAYFLLEGAACSLQRRRKVMRALFALLAAGFLIGCVVPPTAVAQNSEPREEREAPKETAIAKSAPSEIEREAVTSLQKLNRDAAGDPSADWSVIDNFLQHDGDPEDLGTNKWELRYLKARAFAKASLQDLKNGRVAAFNYVLLKQHMDDGSLSFRDLETTRLDVLRYICFAGGPCLSQRV